MSLVVDCVTIEDLEGLAKLARATFIESYAQVDDLVYLKKHLEKNCTLKTIKKEFNTPRVHFFIARVNEQPVGFCKLVSDEDEDHPLLKQQRCIELERMYVLKEFQSLHVDNALMHMVLNFASEHLFETIWLGVSDKNEGAKRFYGQWGFIYFDTHLFDFGGDIQTDILMKRPVKIKDVGEQAEFDQPLSWISKIKKYINILIR
ncbi:MAG: GNAT family N-acetyltransferase [Pedobacter sp.]|nr:MAG: GNAT family N-acetyltransferase [Pedobacter sp.]